MSVADEAKRIAECSHGMAITVDRVSRCPHCGAMRGLVGPWAFPHLVDALVRAWKKDEPTAP